MEHYVDGAAYDRRYEGRTEDIEFYGRVARDAETILEYGAGTGRLTLPLARSGKKVLAVDLSSAMLRVLDERLSLEDKSVRSRVVTQVGDMRTFSTQRKFDLVVVGFHTFCHLYSRADVVAFLARVREHLKPGGVLALDVPVPRIDSAGYESLAQVCITEMDGPRGPELLTQRWYQPEEVRMHLSYGGFERVRFFGDFSREAPSEDTDFLAVTAVRAASKVKTASSTKKAGPGPAHAESAKEPRGRAASRVKAPGKSAKKSSKKTASASC